MTDRIHSFTVILENNIREDDAQATINAIKQLKGVLDVKGNTDIVAVATAEARVRGELARKLWAVLMEDPKGE